MSSPQPDSNAVRAVLFVDVEGTLVPATSSAIFLAARLGHADQVAEAADPPTTMRYDRARTSLDHHATCIVSAYVAGAAR